MEKDKTNKYSIKYSKDCHFKWFKAKLIKNGASTDITEKEVKNSAGYKHSEESFVAGVFIMSFLKKIREG